MEDNTLTKFRKGLFENLGIAVALIVAIVYLFYGLITLQGSGKTISEIIISSFVIWLVGYSIGQLLTLQGILWGEKETSVQDTKKAHGKVIDDIGNDIVYLDYYCAEQTADALKTARTSRLSSVGLYYTDYFNDDGGVIEHNINIPKSKDEITEKRNIKKRKAIIDAIYMKITPLSTDSLTTDNGNKYDPFDYGKDKMQYMRGAAITALFQKLIIGIGFGYYAIKFIQDFEWGYLIWTGIQIGIFLMFGSISLFMAYLFVTDTQRQNRIKKINKLEQFKSTDKTRYKELEEAKRKKMLSKQEPKPIKKDTE